MSPKKCKHKCKSKSKNCKMYKICKLCKSWKISFRILLPFVFLFSCEQALADFAVRSEYQSRLPYGNAETVRFHRAINNLEPLTPCEAAELAGDIPLKESGSYYGRVGVNFSLLTLGSLKNRSKGADSAGIVTRTKVSKGQMGLELAVGYVWSPTVRGELEYLVNRNLTYTATPVFTGVVVPRRINAELKNNTLLINGYYDFEGYDRFRPFLTAGLGIASNSVTSTLTPPSTDSGSGTARTLGLAYSLGLGFRVSIFSRWFINVSYRYINLGPVTILPTSATKLTGIYSMSAPSIGVIYLF